MTSLAISRLTGRPVAGTSAVAAMVPQPDGNGAAASSLMHRMIHPSARDRWMNAAVKDYPPDRVESILRGAMTGNLVAQHQLFELMEMTWPRLAKNLNQLKDAVISVEWPLQPWAPKGGKPSAEAVKRARLCEELIWNMQPQADADENDFEDTLRDLMDARGKGISVLEIDWHLRDYDGRKAFAPRCTRWVHPQYYGYPLTGTGNRLMLDATQIVAGQSLSSPSPGAAGERLGENGTFSGRGEGARLLAPTQDQYSPFPADKFIIGVAKTKSGHPISGALLRVLAFYWSASQFTWEWFLNYAQLFGMPIRFAYYDPTAGPEVIRNIEDMLANMGSSAWGAFPAGTQFEMKEAAKGVAGGAHQELIKMADTICDLLLLRQTLTTDAGDKGTQALGTVHEGVLGEVKLGCARWAAKALTSQLIRPICRLNFGDDRECPWFMPGEETNEDPKAKAERFQILLNAGFAMEKEWAYNEHNIPMPAPGADVIEGRPAPTMGFPGSSPSPQPGENPIPPSPQPSPQREGEDPAAAARAVAAKAVTEVLTDKLLSESTGVQAKWLGGVRPHFHRLIALAQSDKVSDADLITVLEAAAKDMPELYAAMKPDALADALYATMSSACVNGAVQGWMKRHQAKRGGAS